MDVKSFIKQNRQEWVQLDNLIQEITRNKKLLTPEKIENFQVSYQRTAHLLSYSQTFFPQEEVTVYLNGLLAKAHHLLYRDQFTSMFQIKQFFGKTFVRLLREQKRFIFVAMLLFLIGGLGGFLSVWSDPLNLYSILPGQIANNVNPDQLGNSNKVIDSASISATIMTNNIQVAFMAFIGGITLGLFTIYILFYNGLIIGALAALFMEYGKLYDFWAYIVPHGMIELTAIFIAGGSGLLMGYRILVPGSYPRSFQIKRQALSSIQLILGTIPLFIIAGIIEGYITPAPIPLEAKYAFALLTVLALILYVSIVRPD